MKKERSYASLLTFLLQEEVVGFFKKIVLFGVQPDLFLFKKKGWFDG